MSAATQNNGATALDATYEQAHATLHAALPTVAVALDGEACFAYGSMLKNKTVVITGAGSGFGRAFALRAASYGAKVVLSDLRLSDLDSLAAEIKAAKGTCVAVACDVTSWDQQVNLFRVAAAHYGAVDVVFPNAGVTELPGPGDWLRDVDTVSGEPKKPSFITFDINFIGVSYTTKLAFYHLRKNPAKKGKSIVFIGSMASHTGIPGAPMYTAAKHGVLGLFRSTWNDASLEKINTNIICPWFTDTAIVTPLTRFALLGLPLCTVDDVVAAVVRSASDNAFHGNIVAIDAQGILAIPFVACSPGETGYYAEFSRRATISMNSERIIRDLVNVVKATARYWLSTKRSRALFLAILLGIFRYKRRAPAP